MRFTLAFSVAVVFSGQFVARDQMANRVHETLGVPVTYIVANPSDAMRVKNTMMRSLRRQRTPGSKPSRTRNSASGLSKGGGVRRLQVIP